MADILNFQICGKLFFGNGALSSLNEIIQEGGYKKIFLVVDPGVVHAGIDRRVKDILNGSGVAFHSFEKVEADPSVEIIKECATAGKKEGSDLVIGFGGGSALDMAKLTSVLLNSEQDLLSMTGINNIHKPGMPSILIPTTAGTGSEVTPIAVVSDKKEQLKKGVVSDYLYPDFAIVDPELCLSLPPYPTAYTGIDALTHAIEAYTNRFSKPFVDTFALEAIRLISQSLRKAVKDGGDIDARYNMSLGSLYGGMCLGSVNTAAVHALAYPLGGLFDIPHGVANSLLLPYVMEVNIESNVKKFAAIAEAMGESVDTLNLEEAARRSANAVRKLSADCGIISRIRELGVPESSLETMALAATKVTRLLNNNPKELTQSDILEIYLNAY